MRHLYFPYVSPLQLNFEFFKLCLTLPQTTTFWWLITSLSFQRTNSAVLTSRYVLTEILFPLTTLSSFMFVISVREFIKILPTTNAQEHCNVDLLQGILQCFDHLCGHLQWDLNKNTIRITETIIRLFVIVVWLWNFCNCYCILVYNSLRMATWVAETNWGYLVIKLLRSTVVHMFVLTLYLFD